MLPVFWLVLFLLGACLFLLMPFLVGWELYNRHRGSRVVTCPENRQQVAVGFDALHAAVTRLTGSPDLRLAECTRWPERGDCGRECMPEAQRAVPYVKGEVAPSKSKRVYHLPVLIAAFAAWVLGAIWHSHYLFRLQWMQAVGLTRSEMHQIVWQFAPHLLTLGVPLLFAYGVAWSLAWSKKKGLWRGAGTAIIFWAVLAGAGLASTGLADFSGDLLKVELSYTFLASAVIGAIVGSLSGKLVEQTFAK
jgi:hypothetical protein